MNKSYGRSAKKVKFPMECFPVFRGIGEGKIIGSVNVFIKHFRCTTYRKEAFFLLLLNLSDLGFLT